MSQKWLVRLEYADRGVMLRERDIAPNELAVLTQAGLVEYAGLDLYSDCRDCALGPGCPVERMGGTDADPEYIALCPAGESLLYREADLRRWRLTIGAVARMLAEQVGGTSHVEEIVPRRLWALGRMGKAVSLFLFRGVRRPDAAMILAPLHERLKVQKGLVLVPGALPASGILPRNAMAVPLEDVLRVEGTDLLVDKAYLDHLAVALVGATTEPAPSPISVPAGFTWAQVRLEFISDEDVRIWTVGEPVRKSYLELGLANARDGQPNRLWKLLWEFAAYEGVYDPDHRSVLYPPVQHGQRTNAPRFSAFSPNLITGLSQLADHLQQLFPTVPGRPFARYDTRQHRYRSIIRLQWEPGYLQQKAPAGGSRHG